MKQYMSENEVERLQEQESIGSANSRRDPNLGRRNSHDESDGEEDPLSGENEVERLEDEVSSAARQMELMQQLLGPNFTQNDLWLLQWTPMPLSTAGRGKRVHLAPATAPAPPGSPGQLHTRGPPGAQDPSPAAALRAPRVNLSQYRPMLRGRRTGPSTPHSIASPEPPLAPLAPPPPPRDAWASNSSISDNEEENTFNWYLQGLTLDDEMPTYNATRPPNTNVNLLNSESNPTPTYRPPIYKPVHSSIRYDDPTMSILPMSTDSTNVNVNTNTVSLPPPVYRNPIYPESLLQCINDSPIRTRTPSINSNVSMGNPNSMAPGEVTHQRNFPPPNYPWSPLPSTSNSQNNQNLPEKDKGNPEAD